MEEEEAKRDRISELPEEIKEQIVSSLCMKDAIRTSSLSSAWRYTWVSLPFLDFGYAVFKQFRSYFETLPTSHPKKQHLYCSIFHKAEEEDDDSESKVDKNDYEYTDVGYLQMIDELLQIYIKKNPSSRVLKKISLFVPPMLFDSDKMRDYGALIVSRCLSLTKHNVTELDYRIDNLGWQFRPKDSYRALQNCLPILDSKTLTKLVLKRCYLARGKKVQLTSRVKQGDVPIDLPNLKHLRLMQFNVGENMLETLLAKCPALEELNFSLCEGFNVLRIPRLSKLKELQVISICDLDLLEINAMSLQCLVLIHNNTNKCKLKMDSNSCKSFVNLDLLGCDVTDDFFNNVAEFPHLETLFLMNCPELKHIKITSNSLTRFEVKDCPNLSRTELVTPKLIAKRGLPNNQKPFFIN